MSTTPQYILLTIGTIITPDQRKPGTAHMTVIQPPVVKLMPLPMHITREQNPGGNPPRAEIEMPGHILRCVDTFDDVLYAIADAADSGEAIARPIQRDAITKAAQAAVEIPADMTRIGKVAEPGEVRWDDVMQTSGENTGKPVKQPDVGALRIVLWPDNNWRVECYRPEPADSASGNTHTWSHQAAPIEVQGGHGSQEAAYQAVKVAGYARKLIEA